VTRTRFHRAVWDENEKFCPRCHRWLPVEAFGANRRMFRGLHSYCRQCAREAVRAWRREHPEYEAEYNRQRRERYRELNPLPADRRCVHCGGPMGDRKADALVCSDRCRWARKRAQKKARAAGLLTLTLAVRAASSASQWLPTGWK
jgi:predicted nucleic acid-binding Zn ribbon protein